MSVFVGVVCCQVEVSATGLSHVQRSPTECVRCNSNPPYLQRVGRRDQTKKKNGMMDVEWIHFASN